MFAVNSRAKLSIELITEMQRQPTMSYQTLVATASRLERNQSQQKGYSQMVNKLQNAFLPNSVSQVSASVNAVTEETPTRPRTQGSKKRGSGGGLSINYSKGKLSGKSSPSPTHYDPVGSDVPKGDKPKSKGSGYCKTCSDKLGKGNRQMCQYSRAWSKGNDCYWPELGKNNQPPKNRNFPAGKISTSHTRITTQKE